ncbi:MAG: hypothetical protein HOY76_20685 [Streptomyces sp.]|nr:hypothetical protein [Streptomyces sp.]
MRAPIASAATCTTLTAILALSACGGSDKAQDRPTGTGTRTSTSPVTTTSATPPSPSPTASVRPAITLPPDAKDVFEDRHTGDPVKDAVLADNEQWVMAVDDGLIQGTAATKPLGFYTAGIANGKTAVYIGGARKKNYSWTGTLRYFDRRATLEDDGTASVIYCSDESRAFLKDRTTGKVDHNATTSRSYVLYNTHLTKNAQGVWQTDNVSSVRGAKQCVPKTH